MFNVCLSATVRIIVPGVLTYGTILKKTLVSFYHYTELSIFSRISTYILHAVVSKIILTNHP